MAFMLPLIEAGGGMLAEEAAALVESQVARAAAGAGLSKGVVNALTAAAGNAAHSAVSSGVEYATKKRKIDSSTVKSEKAADPQNSNAFAPPKSLPIGASQIFTGGEAVQRSMRLSIGHTVYKNPLLNYLRDFYVPHTWKSQFALQYVGDDQTRSCQGLLFRHRVSGDILNANLHILKPTATYQNPRIGTSAPGTAIQGLPYNFFNAGVDNMQLMVSMMSMGGIEDLAQYITPPSALIRSGTFYNPAGSNTSPGTTFTVPAITSNMGNGYGTWIQDYCLYTKQQPSDGTRAPRIHVGVKAGGVNLFFENKHPVGSYVEVVMYKLRRSVTDTFSVTFPSNGVSPVMADLENHCGNSYVHRKISNVVSRYTSGRIPLVSDVTTNPYFPLLPKADINGGHYQQATYDPVWSEKARSRFHLASGNKRALKVSFGGVWYDPVDSVAASCEDTILLVIAVNGQMVSAYATQGDQQLVTGDVAAGHNMLIRAEHWETVYPLDVKRTKHVFSQGTMEPKIPSVGTTGVDIHAYQMLGAYTAQRGNNITLEAGGIIDPTDGNNSDDKITP